MTFDDMARELRAAGWFQRYPERWLKPGTGAHDWYKPMLTTGEAWEELAQQRAQGAVNTPVVGRRRSDMAKKTMKVTNGLATLARFAAWYAEQDSEEKAFVCEAMNKLFDEMSEQDAFGTEGQNDPRGDRRG